jgi:hypothetical protein
MARDAGTVNVTHSLPERGQIERGDVLIGRQQSHSVGTSERGYRLKRDAW